MKKKLIIIVLAGWFIIPALGQHSPQDKNWQVVFQDNFNSFNGQRWYKANQIHGDEPQHYIPNNITIINNEKLILTTKKEIYTCTKINCNCGNGTFNYTSGQIVSNAKYKYGYFEIYAKLPSGTAFFPGFWLWDTKMTPPNCFYNEIDIMEANGCDPTWVSSNFQATFDCLNEERGAKHHICNYANGSYHWYGVEWDRDKITWYVDRKTVRQIYNNEKGIGIQNPMSIIINLALFPQSWGKCPINNALFPNYMYIDTANVYCLNCNDKNIVVNEITNFNIFNFAVKKSITMSNNTIIPARSNISLRATDFIELKNGFEVPLGAELYLDINPCENIGIIK